MDQDPAAAQSSGANHPVSPEDVHHSPSSPHEPLTSSWTGSSTKHEEAVMSGSLGRSQLHTTDSRDSRPTSPHNVSSPVASRGNDKGQNFLAVPKNLRSRQNSVDSEDGSKSVTTSQGDTTVFG